MKRILLVICLFFLGAMHAQVKLPPVHNFTVKEYHAGNQNWDLIKNQDYLFVANNEGLLEFDGMKWRLYTLPNKTIMRSVTVDGNRVYTGSYEEFGFWKRQPTGELAYTSLLNTIKAEEIETESIWSIYAFNGNVIFKSFSSLFIYNVQTGKTTVIKSDITLTASNVINNSLYVFGGGKGIMKLENNELVLIEETTFLKDFKVQSIVPYKNGQILVGTLVNGCFIYENGKFTPWKSPFNELLIEHQLNTITVARGSSKIFFGTIRNGIFVYDTSNDTFYDVNVKYGLQNNTVLESVFDENQVLWLALDNGVSAVPINNYAHYLNPNREDIGAVYDMVKLKNAIYMATNIGIYKIGEDGITFIKGSESHTWDLELVGDEIICGHNLGTYRIKDDQFMTINKKDGGYTFVRIPQSENEFIEGNYLGLTLYRKVNGNWEYHDIANLHFPVKRIVFEKPHVAWAAHPYKGVYRLHFSEDYSTVVKIEEQYNGQLPNWYDIRLFGIEGNIAVFSVDSWFRYNPLEDRMEPFESLNKILGADVKSFPISNPNENPIVFKKEDGSIFIRSRLQDSTSQVHVPNRLYEGKLVTNEERAVSISDSLVYIAMYNDILAVNPLRITSMKKVPTPQINRVFKNGIPQSITEDIELRQRDTLIMETSIPFLSNSVIGYKTSPDDNFWNLAPDGKIVLTGMPYGDNVLKLRSYSNASIASEESAMSFYIIPPWYMGIGGILLLLAILAGVFMIIVTINKYVLIKHKKYLDEQFEHERELHRKEEAIRHEKQINELLKKQHQVELNSKTKELANTAMAMTKKNELLQELKNDMMQFKSEVLDKGRYSKIIRNLERNINNSKDWEVFETNFNAIHDSFFRSLLELHPDQLTPKDLKLCAYLKMNLSTKEISPLMGISVRGVEIHRYRLRKKLDLDTDQNLNEYLMSIS